MAFFKVYDITILLSAITFVIYGFLCLSTEHMSLEFERYGLMKFKKLVGVLELLGGAGQLLSFFYSSLLLSSSLGLAILMLLGVGVRIKVKDPWQQTFPAALLMIINSYIVFSEV